MIRRRGKTRSLLVCGTNLLEYTAISEGKDRVRAVCCRACVGFPVFFFVLTGVAVMLNRLQAEPEGTFW